MDILRKELNALYASQNLSREVLPENDLENSKGKAAIIATVNNSCTVITDVAKDKCYIYGGALAKLLGLSDNHPFATDLDSSDEDMIYYRIHPEDLAEKRMLEFEFFKYVDTLEAKSKLANIAHSRIRIKDAENNYLYIDNSTQVICISPHDKIWLVLCCYTISPDQSPAPDIHACIVDRSSGNIKRLYLSEKRSKILTEREKEILLLVKKGKSSKQIAADLGISINTVSRHRQNILEKLSVGNSPEAIMAATSMRLL